MPNYTYENKVIENKYNSVLLSDLQDSDFLTVDESLTASAGDTVEIVTRTVSGTMQDVAMGAGNTEDITVSATVAPYKVKTKQGRFIYYDEEAKRDPACVDAGVQGMAEVARNAWLEDAFFEYSKAHSKQIETATANFDAFADAVALFGEKDTDLRALINPADVAKLRKALKDDLKYSEDFARTGYIGLCCGVPIKRSSAVPVGEILIVQKDAVTLFVAKNSEIEQERDANLRKNSVFSRKQAICALTREDHVVRIAQHLSVDGGISFNSPNNSQSTQDYNKAGSHYLFLNYPDTPRSPAGATVQYFVNGHLVYIGKTVYDGVDYNEAKAELDEPLKKGDVVKGIIHIDGYCAAETSFTVA